MAMAAAAAGSASTCLNTKSLVLSASLKVSESSASSAPVSIKIPSLALFLQKSQNAFCTNTDMASKGLAAALFASLAATDSAMAANQVLDMVAAAPDNDSRGLALLVPLVPALGWVLFNILQPGLNQFNKMKGAKSIAAGVGLGALAMLALNSDAQAAQEVAQIAEGDNRGLLLLGIILPAIGWVLFNILQPALNQFNKMKSAKGLAAAAGLGASAGLLLAVPQADAVQEIASIAEGDSRGLLLLGIILPAIGWVLFNILQPAVNQINKMRTSK